MGQLLLRNVLLFETVHFVGKFSNLLIELLSQNLNLSIQKGAVNLWLTTAGFHWLIIKISKFELHFFNVL